MAKDRFFKRGRSIEGPRKLFHVSVGRFPFRAEYGEQYGHPEPVEVIGLGDPGDELMIDEMYGILCEARMEGQNANVPLGELEGPTPI